MMNRQPPASWGILKQLAAGEKNTGAPEYGISRGENGAWRRRFATSGYGADGDSRSLFIWIFDTYLLLL